jgi:hypothetical protein
VIEMKQNYIGLQLLDKNGDWPIDPETGEKLEIVK